MAKQLPYYPYYTADFRESKHVLAMNLSEVGLYQLSLNWAWDYGSIPDDPGELARLLQRDRNEVKRAWPKVRPCWVPSPEQGRLVNQRMEAERVKAIDKSDKASVSAKYSHSARRANALAKAKAVAIANASANALANGVANHIADELHRASGISSADTENTSENRENPNARDAIANAIANVKFDVLPGCQLFMQEYPGELNDLVPQLYISLIENAVDEVKLFINLKLHRQSRKWKDGFVPTAENFLSKGIWKFPPPKEPDKPKSKLDEQLAQVVAQMASEPRPEPKRSPKEIHLENLRQKGEM
ncbi:MAG TPA: hypothetical protein VNL17_14645 [Verrucomicrobiae bacterium]|nr:hypothetical protein [Verrucomicrobiae bacterium]